MIPITYDSKQILNQTIYFSSSEHMTEISDNSIDVIVTSPPYNRGKQYSSDSNTVHNDEMPEEDYFNFLDTVWQECLRVATTKAVFFLNVGDAADSQGLSEKVAQTAENAGWIRIQDIIWVKSIYGKGHYTPSGGNKRFNNLWEHIYLFVKDRKQYELDPKAIGIPYADKSNIGRYGEEDLRDPGNVFHIWYEKTTGAQVKKGHDAPFPIGLPYQCIKAVPNVKTVLDPFLGTGTTLAAAQALGIHGVGYEKFPREQLIQATIQENQSYKPEDTILIPHLEQSLITLVKIFESVFQEEKADPLRNSNLLHSPTSKKQRLQWEILVDTLQKLDIKSDLLDKLTFALHKKE